MQNGTDSSAILRQCTLDFVLPTETLSIGLATNAEAERISLTKNFTFLISRFWLCACWGESSEHDFSAFLCETKNNMTLPNTTGVLQRA